MAAATNFSRVGNLFRLTRCRCQSKNVFLRAASRRHHCLQHEPRSPIRWLSLKQQQNGLRYNTRLMSTNTQTQTAEKDDTLISGLPYNLLDFVPRLTYSFLISDSAEKIDKRIPIKKPNFCRLMTFLEKQEHVNHAEARTLLESTGLQNADFTDAKRAEFTRWVWNKIQQIGDENVTSSVHLFNIYMRVLLDNKEPLAPSEALAEMEARQLTPNRITYLMLIASACERGDMEEGRKQLAEMKKLSYPISISLYNSLIRGYCKAGDIEKAEEMFKSIGSLKLEANDMTYANLMLCHAERGHFAQIKELMDNMEEAGILLNQHKTLEVVVLLANGGHIAQAEEVVEILKDKIQPSVADVAMAVTSLLNNGHDELAFKVNDLLGVKVGKFFYERAVACYMPADRLVGFVRRCEKMKYRTADLGVAVREAGFYGEFDKALELYQHMGVLDTPESDHLYPVIQYYCDKGTLDDLLKLQPLLEKMNFWDYAIAMEHFYPGLRKKGKSADEVVQILRKHTTLKEEEFNAGMIRTMLCKEPLSVVHAEVQKMKNCECIFLTSSYLPALISNHLRSPNNWREVFEFIVEIKKKRKFEENCFFAFEEAKKLLSNSGMSLEPLIDFMIENNLKVPQYKTFGVQAPGVSREKLEQIVAVRQQPMEIAKYTAELEQMFPEDNFVLRHYLARAANSGDKRTVDGILRRKKFREDMFVDMPSKLALIEMYAKFSDADNALLHVRQLVDRMPKFKLPPHAILAIAVALCKDNRYEEAIDVLCTYPAERNLLEDMHVKRKQDFRENLNYLLSLDIAEGPELRKVLVENKFMKGKVHKEIDRPIEDLLASDEEVKKLTMDQIQSAFQNLIKKDQKNELQRASDIFSKHNSVRKVLYRLSAAFAVEGKSLQARKVLQLPGIQPDREEISDICKYFIKEKFPISSIENFQEVLKNTGYRFDPDKAVLFAIFRRIAQTDLGKAKEFLEGGFEAHGESTPVGAYFYLSNAYKQAGKPVPFSIPFVPVRGKKTGEQRRPAGYVADAVDSRMSGRKAETLKTKASSQANASPKTRGTPKGSEVIEAPVSDIMEKTEDQGSDIIEKAEEIKDVMAQTDPAVEITEIEEPVKEVLNPSASS